MLISKVTHTVVNSSASWIKGQEQLDFTRGLFETRKCGLITEYDHDTCNEYFLFGGTILLTSAICTVHSFFVGHIVCRSFLGFICTSSRLNCVFIFVVFVTSTARKTSNIFSKLVKV